MPRAGFLGWSVGGPFGEVGGLALAGPGRFVESAAIVLGLQVVKASLKGLAASTRDGLHIPLKAGREPQLLLTRPHSRDQFELDALIRYDVANN